MTPKMKTQEVKKMIQYKDMKDLKEYIIERGAAPKVTEEELDKVWVIKDKDLDGAILDVCATEADAKKAYDGHMKENEGNHLEIVPSKRSEVEKK